MFINLIDEYYYIEFDQSFHPEQIEQIYSKKHIRPFKSSIPPSMSDIHKIEVVIPQSLTGWAQSFSKALPLSEQKKFYDQMLLFTKKAGVYGITFNLDHTAMVALGP
jgi:hypothetical protein